MSSLVDLRTAIVASIDTNVAAFRTVRAHGGKLTADEIKAYATRQPACLVACLGGPTTREAGQPVMNAIFVAGIITTGTSQTARDAAGLILGESVTALAARNSWGYTHAKAPTNVRLENFYHRDVDRLGVSLFIVSWQQRVDIDIQDVDTISGLSDFNRHVDSWDLAPIDGVIEMQSDVWLNGTFMSAYGQLYVSSPAATSIAVAGTYQKAAGTTVLSTTPIAVDMSMPVVNRLNHDGTAAKPFAVSGKVSVTVSADAKVSIALAKGGVVNTDTIIEEEVTLAGGAEAIPVQGIFSLDEDEYIEVWVTADDTVNVTLTKMTLVAVAT